MHDFENSCKQLAVSSIHPFSWEWDSRFLCALTTFPTTKQEVLTGAIAEYFPQRWDSKTIREAPALIKRLADYLGGVQAGQEIFALHHDSQPGGLAALWPWGNGMTVSLRVLPILSQFPADETAARLASFKNCFGI